MVNRLRTHFQLIRLFVKILFWARTLLRTHNDGRNVVKIHGACSFPMNAKTSNRTLRSFGFSGKNRKWKIQSIWVNEVKSKIKIEVEI